VGANAMSDFNQKIGKLIKRLREEKGISQEMLASKLEVQRTTVSHIENGSRVVSVKEIKDLSKIFNVSVETLMGMKAEPEVILEKKDVYLKNNKKTDMRINVPQKNIQKFKEVFLYILGQIGSRLNIGETVIYKLLYFMDFDFYEKYEEQLIGATYIKNHHGPTPVEFKTIVDDMISEEEVVRVKSKYFQYDQTKYLPLREPKLEILKAHEIDTICQVIKKLADMNAKQISDYSHNDVPWLTTEDGEKIEYESVFYRTGPYSVRQEDAEIQ
jgi:transcriptional regulator with XRE-family HTH domain